MTAVWIMWFAHLARTVTARSKLHYFDLLWIYCTRTTCCTTNPQQSEVMEFGLYRAWLCCLKAKIHYTSFPVASPEQVCSISDKSVTSWRGQKSVVSVVSCRFPNRITTTCCGRVANKSVTSWQLPCLRGNVYNGFGA